MIQQQISDHKKIEGVQRSINIVGIHMNSDAATFDLYYRINYLQNDDDISNMFNPQVPAWHINNTHRMMVRDENFEPILNPDFIEQTDDAGAVINEEERYQAMPAFDYIKMLMLDMNMPMKSILQAYIAEEDKDGRFDF